MTAPILETKRLILRALEPTDAGMMRKLAGSREVAATTLNIPHPYPEGIAEEFIAITRQRMAERTGYTFGMIRKEGTVFMGCIGLVVSEDHLRAEMGYWIGKPYWNMGYTTEAARRMMQYGFEALDLNRICATYFADNVASGRVMQKIGMTYEGTLRQHILKWGKFHDLVCYGIVRADYTNNTD